MELTFYYDVVCPYAYMASVQIEQLATRLGADVRWQPVLLGGVLRAVGAPDDPNAVMVDAAARLKRLDIHRSAELVGLDVNIPQAHPRRTLTAMRLAVAAPAALRPAVSRALFEAYWQHGADVASLAVVGEIAGRFGLDPRVIEAPATKAALREATDNAVSRGVFGVPSFAIGSRILWGQDRLWGVEAHLGGTPDARGAPLAGQPRRWTPKDPQVTFFHDFASPFSYLAATQIESVVTAAGGDVRWTPVLVGALFRAIGTPDVPLFELNSNKQAWIRRDLEDWATAWGVPFRFPTHFPLRSLLPLRAALVEPEVTSAIYRAVWAEDRRVDDPQSLGVVLSDAGFDAEAILRASLDPAIKDTLRENTTAAQTAGACGVPTYRVERDVGDPLLVWGQDRLALLATVLRGWWPRAEL